MAQVNMSLRIDAELKDAFMAAAKSMDRKDRKSTRLNSITAIDLVCRLLLEKKNKHNHYNTEHHSRIITIY